MKWFFYLILTFLTSCALNSNKNVDNVQEWTKIVKEKIQNNVTLIKTCGRLLDFQQNNPEIIVTVFIKVQPLGILESINLKSTQTTKQDFQNCMTTGVRQIHFPTFAEEPVREIEQPISFVKVTYE